MKIKQLFAIIESGMANRKFTGLTIVVGFLVSGVAMRAFALHVSQRTDDSTPKSKEIALAFKAFAPAVRTHSDDKWFYVESNGVPDHTMMVGITNWQQRVPLPQPYVGSNAWQFPLTPVPAANPLSAKNHFFRGAMAIAANGVPVFNALNNRGENSFAIGELDQFGGHCGRADDYHYHIAPTQLQKTVGKDKPIGYALDGYALYGFSEPDGSEPGKLDEFNGHTTTALGYHYHATKTYPYLNGGFHGEVTERGGQVDPQPRSRPIRPDTRPLRGAKITDFARPKAGNYELKYTLNGQTYKINYTLQADGNYKFDYIDGDGKVTSETYSSGRGNGIPVAPQTSPFVQDVKPTESSTKFKLTSSAVGKDGKLPVEFTGDGSSISPPLEWTNAPKGTNSFAVIMHHIDPQGVTKWYWTLYTIPSTVSRLEKGVKGIGTFGNNSINNRREYAPPHSKGPGVKKYVITIYALDAAPTIHEEPWMVNRQVLLDAMKGHILGASELTVSYERPS